MVFGMDKWTCTAASSGRSGVTLFPFLGLQDLITQNYMQWNQQSGHSSDLNTPLQVTGGVFKNAAGSIIIGEVSF